MTAGRQSGRRGAGALVAFATAIVVSGCSLLFPGFEGSPIFHGDPNASGELGPPSARATYVAGKATISTNDGTKVTLDRLNGGAQVLAGWGANARLSNSQGWSLRVAAAGLELGPNAPDPGVDAFVELDRIVAGKHLSTRDPSRCVVTVTTVDERALRGKATCKGLQWFDALDVPTLGEPPDTGAPKFDAEITFEATS